ncbi:histone H1B, sperm-like [Copidosoma floridanum]|uniref:histone H1B, sperm-like n=1 Tax=Copidosoma floridanum TaxID=29053 RepID=UPI0006C9A1AA|nr:histone H1B, sperm-like [Copidosoma floridanum]
MVGRSMVPSGAAVASAKKAAAAKAAAAKRLKSRQPSAARKSSSGSAKVGELVESAIAGLKESGGSSLAAIKRYLAANHNVDVEKLTPAIKKYLKATSAGGSRAGTFKLSPAKKRRSSSAAPKKSTPAKKTKATVKKPGSPKKKSSKPLAAKPPKPKSKKPAKKSPVATGKPRKTAATKKK